MSHVIHNYRAVTTILGGGLKIRGWGQASVCGVLGEGAASPLHIS